MRQVRRGLVIAVAAVAVAALLVGCSGGSGSLGAAREVPHLRNEDAEVFLRLHATPSQVAAVRRAVRRSTVVDQFAFLDRDEALREFRRLFRDQPDLVATTAREDLPASIRVKLRDERDVRTLRGALRGIAGYDEIIDRHHPKSPTEKSLMRTCRQLDITGSMDAEAFMTGASSPATQAAVRRLLDEAPEVERYQFLSQQDALAVFGQLFADDAHALATTTAQDLPPSFRIWFRAGTDHRRLLAELQRTPDVDEVKVADPTLRRVCYFAA